jgi:hypothetical protein
MKGIYHETTIKGMDLMKIKGHISSAVIIFIMAFLSSGCASFRSGDLHPVNQWPLPNAGKGKSIDIALSGKSTFNGKEQPESLTLLRYWREQAEKAYQDSGLFSGVTTGNPDTDLRAEIEITDSTKRRIGLLYLAGLTLYLLPSKGTDELMVRTTIKGRDGAVIGTYEKTETINNWVQLFLVFAAPFHSSNSVYEETFYDLNRSTIAELHAKGFL